MVNKTGFQATNPSPNHLWLCFLTLLTILLKNLVFTQGEFYHQLLVGFSGSFPEFRHIFPMKSLVFIQYITQSLLLLPSPHDLDMIRLPKINTLQTQFDNPITCPNSLTASSRLVLASTNWSANLSPLSSTLNNCSVVPSPSLYLILNTSRDTLKD